MKFWNVEQLRTFLDSVAGERAQPIWLLMATTGMRRGEVLGLRWRDIDLDAGLLSVVRSVVMVHRTILVSEPKTDRGRRSIALDSVTADALRRFRRRQLQERLAYGEGYEESGLVAVHEDGTAITPRLLSSWFVQRTRAAGLPSIRLHDLRH